MKKVIGLDLSIACTGVAGRGWVVTIPTKAYTKKKGRDPLQEERNRIDNHHARVEHVVSTLREYIYGADLVVMEGLSFDSYDTDRQNAGLAWIVRHRLHALDIPYALVPPSNLKRYAIGKGGGKDANGIKIDKSHVIAAVASWFPGLTEDNNAADAMVLAAMGCDQIGEPMPEVTPGKRAALAGCHWPLLASDEETNLALAA